MKKYAIIISIIMGIGILFTCLTCTYFDGLDAAGVGDAGPQMFWMDWYGTIFQSSLNYPYFDRKELYSPPDTQTPTCIVADQDKDFFFWAESDTSMNYYFIYKSPINTFDQQLMYTSTLGSSINSIAVHPEQPALYFEEDGVLYWMSTDSPYDTYSIGDYTGYLSYITDIAVDPDGGFIYFVGDTSDLFREIMPPGSPNMVYWTTMLNNISQIAFDRPGNRIICTDGMEIFSLKDPFNTDYTIVTSECSQVLDLVADPGEGYVYWLDLGDMGGVPNGIHRTEIEGSGQREEIFIFNPDNNESAEVFTIGFPFEIQQE